MSKHWKPSYASRRRTGWSAAEVRLAALSGVLLGLVMMSLPSGPRPAISVTDGVETVVLETVDIANVRVVDGDTFDHLGVRIRIADIDTPEVDGRCQSETRLAARATERMRQLLRSGPFELHPIAGRDEDQYGRKLRIVTRDGSSLGDQLVEEGLARTWSGRREPWC